MEKQKARKGISSFPRNFWTVIVMEFFERGSYYGVMSILSVYLVLDISQGGLGFSKESVGVIKSVITPLLYLLPILSGALADQFGYKKTLIFS
ncbi:MAG: peptide MFS transporter, partial [Rikenellaceae bacterium]|nr:peptide MFS transporter [Rikenellaceae bacterium]